ncbi:N-acyltransferase YncA [Clostridium tepidiprofundi DSM 19306]|uniref:N-acyltransferase YncA n=1 Tax=Clostridium tepidiprofundi DSM 19306 TaxID=1121338 RepID=A0A151B776_9CLOT|nr:GNAT family N-acetyltransferase [Clostridium tepidiprofundi]KYH35775.1 N-acyltransferase YncA [Clostridium tepidiprofundi DSM 19306]
MNYIIRPIQIEDAKFINEIRRMDGVRENIMGIKSDRISKTEEFIRNLSPNNHILVAEIQENNIKKVVGMVGLTVNQSPRVRHSGYVVIFVHKNYQGMGIGRTLLNQIIDLADNWLMLVRLELGVFTDNEVAINLYKSLGFVIEGTKKFAAIRNGKYVDEYIMGRYSNLH